MAINQSGNKWDGFGQIYLIMQRAPTEIKFEVENDQSYLLQQQTAIHWLKVQKTFVSVL